MEQLEENSRKKKLKLFEIGQESIDGIMTLDRQHHATPFINPIPAELHLQQMAHPDFVYPRIEIPEQAMAGYFLLVAEPDNCVEFRRIVIDENARGIGQLSILQMEEYCREFMGARRIWLDVYDDNAIGQHVYEKLGYVRFNTELINSRPLHFYHKHLDQAE